MSLRIHITEAARALLQQSSKRKQLEALQEQAVSSTSKEAKQKEERGKKGDESLSHLSISWSRQLNSFYQS
jgi:hypothetical protein